MTLSHLYDGISNDRRRLASAIKIIANPHEDLARFMLVKREIVDRGFLALFLLMRDGTDEDVEAVRTVAGIE